LTVIGNSPILCIIILTDLSEITGYSVTTLLAWQGALGIVAWRLRSGTKLYDQGMADRIIDYADHHPGRQNRAPSKR
jgi:hypothetical protein